MYATELSCTCSIPTVLQLPSIGTACKTSWRVRGCLTLSPTPIYCCNTSVLEEIWWGTWMVVDACTTVVHYYAAQGSTTVWKQAQSTHDLAHMDSVLSLRQHYTGGHQPCAHIVQSSHTLWHVFWSRKVHSCMTGTSACLLWKNNCYSLYSCTKCAHGMWLLTQEHHPKLKKWWTA